MAPPAASSQRRSRRRRTTSALVLVGTAALAALAATTATPASAARVLTSGGGGGGTGGGWGGGMGGGQIAKAVKREEEKLQKQIQQRVGGGGGGGGGGGWLPQQQQRLGKLPASDCLFLFDLDRSLTGIQGSGSGGDNSCPADKTTSITDKAYRGGALTFSDLALNMASTYAGKNCYLGIISAGNATSDSERSAVAKLLSSDSGNAKMPRAADLKWTDLSKSSTPAPFLFNAPDAKTKYKQVWIIQKYYKENGAEIRDDRVFFSDDISANVEGWKTTNYNAQQISCASRDGTKDLGRCGGTVAEMKHWSGCKLCNGSC